MTQKILITGGAGFIGSHLADALLLEGNEVIILDILHPQVHPTGQIPPYLSPKVTFIQGDVRDLPLMTRLINDIDVVYHLASFTGVAQSMYQIADYVDSNMHGTASLLQAITQTKNKVQKLILSSTRAIYGEGAYHCSCGAPATEPRSFAALEQKEWELYCLNCAQPLTPIPTPETALINPNSVYALSKQHQEQLCFLIGQTYNLPVIALRFFNVYGPRQALNNPYTGVIAAFITQLISNQQAELYEDGTQSRDFVHVSDVVQACLLAKNNPIQKGVFNVGSEERLTLAAVAETIRLVMEEHDLITHSQDSLITSKYRLGDIRHCFADLTQIKSVLGYQPNITFAMGIKQLIEQLPEQQWENLLHKAEEELQKRGLTNHSK